MLITILLIYKFGVLYYVKRSYFWIYTNVSFNSYCKNWTNNKSEKKTLAHKLAFLLLLLKRTFAKKHDDGTGSIRILKFA